MPKRNVLDFKEKVQSLPFKNRLKSTLRFLARNALKVSVTKHCEGKLFSRRHNPVMMMTKTKNKNNNDDNDEKKKTTISKMMMMMTSNGRYDDDMTLIMINDNSAFISTCKHSTYATTIAISVDRPELSLNRQNIQVVYKSN